MCTYEYIVFATVNTGASHEQTGDMSNDSVERKTEWQQQPRAECRQSTALCSMSQKEDDVINMIYIYIDY